MRALLRAAFLSLSVDVCFAGDLHSLGHLIRDLLDVRCLSRAVLFRGRSAAALLRAASLFRGRSAVALLRAAFLFRGRSAVALLRAAFLFRGRMLFALLRAASPSRSIAVCFAARRLSRGAVWLNAGSRARPTVGVWRKATAIELDA